MRYSSLLFFLLFSLSLQAQNDLIGTWTGIGIRNNSTQPIAFKWEFKANQQLATYIARSQNSKHYNSYKEWENYTWNIDGNTLSIEMDGSPVDFKIIQISDKELMIKNTSILYKFTRSSQRAAALLDSIPNFNIYNFNIENNSFPKGLTVEFIQFEGKKDIFIYAKDGYCLMDATLSTIGTRSDFFYVYCNPQKLKGTLEFTEVSTTQIKGFINSTIPFSMTLAKEFPILTNEDLLEMNIELLQETSGHYLLKRKDPNKPTINIGQKLVIKPNHSGTLKYPNLRNGKTKRRPIQWFLSKNGDYLHLASFIEESESTINYQRSYKIEKVGNAWELMPMNCYAW